MTGTVGSVGRVHVIGAGLAGLAAAIDLAGRRHRVVLHEASPHAGGRCRSFFDSELGVRIDNGNHLLLSGNTAAVAYIDRIGAAGTFAATGVAAIPFVDLATGERWSVRPGCGRLPWWMLSPARRVPGTRIRDYLGALRLCRARPGDTVAGLLQRDSMLFRRLWQPFAVAALNTAAPDASARLFRHLLAETIGRGAAACRPLLAQDGLSESLVDPALAFLARHGCKIRFGARLRSLGFTEGRVAELGFDDGTIPLRPADSVVLAVPASVAARLVPGLVVPDDYAPIVNAHFRYALAEDAPPFVGLVGGTAEWAFRKREVVSVTVSAADRLVDEPAEALRATLWRDVSLAFSLPLDPVPPARILKERRATFRATPAQLQRRPLAATGWNNLHLAGDYVDSRLPATIEGAIRSGFAAAARVRRCPLQTPAAIASPASNQPPELIEDCHRALP